MLTQIENNKMKILAQKDSNSTPFYSKHEIMEFTMSPTKSIEINRFKVEARQLKEQHF
jgi:hypothetical protein